MRIKKATIRYGYTIPISLKKALKMVSVINSGVIFNLSFYLDNRNLMIQIFKYKAYL